MKNRIVVLFLLSFIYSQSFSQTDTIFFNKKERKLVFPTKTIIVPEGKTVIFSPEKKKVAVYRYIGDSSRIIEIFDIHGLVRKYRVPALGGMAISDDGRFAVFGSQNYEHIPTDFKYYLYYTNGILEFESNDIESLSHKILFSNDIAVFCYDIISQNHALKIDIYDSKYSLIGDYTIKEWDFSFSILQFDRISKDTIIIKAIDADNMDEWTFTIDIGSKTLKRSRR